VRDEWPGGAGEQGGGACSVCGGPLDEAGRVVQVELRGRTVRACAQSCRERDGAPGARTRAASRLKDLYVDINQASASSDIAFRDALPMLLKLIGEQCDLLWVTGPGRHAETPARSRAENPD
jgi:hypothetical protein